MTWTPLNKPQPTMSRGNKYTHVHKRSHTEPRNRRDGQMNSSTREWQRGKERKMQLSVDRLLQVYTKTERVRLQKRQLGNVSGGHTTFTRISMFSVNPFSAPSAILNTVGQSGRFLHFSCYEWRWYNIPTCSPVYCTTLLNDTQNFAFFDIVTNAETCRRDTKL